jgi:hypothetical protein
MIGSFSGEGGEFFLVDKDDHLNRNIKVKAKMAKTKGCRKLNIFLSINCIYIYIYGVPSYISSFIANRFRRINVTGVLFIF